MANPTQIMNSFNELSQELIPKAYLPAIENVAFKKKRSWFTNRIPRSSKDVNGLQVYLTFLTKMPWAWRSMSEYGFTPTGSKWSAEEQNAQLSCHAASAIVSHTEIEATAKEGPARWKQIIQKEMEALGQTFPYYIRAMLWSSQNSKKAIGKAASISGTTVTLDNAGLWNTATEDRAKLFEPGMFVQVYRSDSKVGSPVEVTSVNKGAGTVTLASDPGVQDNDVFCISDIAGQDVPYTDLMPGILDVIDDDNTFQGIDRSASGNEQFQAQIQDATGETLDHTLLTDFFHSTYDPDYAFTSWKVIRKYWQDNLEAQRRFQPGNDPMVDGYNAIQVGKTKLVEDEDCDEDKIIVPDFDNMRIADRGQFENLFDKGWQQVPQRPFMEYTVVYWGLLLARDCRYMGMLDNISLN